MAKANSGIFAYTSTGTKIPIIVPDGYVRYNVLLVPTSSTAKLQHTVTPREVVESDPSMATWEDWPDGFVTDTTSSRLVGAATAIRVDISAGTDVKLEVNFTA